MPRRRKWAGPTPPPPATTFLICHPADDWYVRFIWPERTNETIVISDRCPMQHLVRLPLKFKLLAQSGVWFDSEEAGAERSALTWRQSFAATLADSQKPRCQAQTSGGTQCSRG